MWDIPGQIRQALVEFVSWMARTGLRPVLRALGDSVLATPALTGNRQVRTVWTTSLVAANAIFVLFVIAGGFIVASRQTLQTSYGLKQIAPRVVVAGLAANLSLVVCGKGIEVANALTAAIVGPGVNGAAAARVLADSIGQALTGDYFLLALLALAVLVMAVVVVITFLLRCALLVVLIGIAPLALMCHATPQTEGLAYAWWRALAACLAMQLGQAVILLATLKVFLTPAGSTVAGVPSSHSGLTRLLVCVTMLWLLIKLPGWTRHFVIGSLGRRTGRGLVGQLVHAYLGLKTLVAVTGIARSGGRVASGRVGRQPPPAHRAPGSGPGRPRPPQPSSPRSPRPKPAGPATFSHAPASHTPLPQPAGATSPPAFSDAPRRATPRHASASSGGPVRFSHASTAPALPARSAPAAPVRFSDTPPAPPRVRRPDGPAPSVPFSSAPRPQEAPKRPPAPSAPVFSDAPTPRPTAARRPGPTPRRHTPPGHGGGMPPPASGSGRTTSPQPRTHPRTSDNDQNGGGAP